MEVIKSFLSPGSKQKRRSPETSPIPISNAEIVPNKRQLSDPPSAERSDRQHICQEDARTETSALDQFQLSDIHRGRQSVILFEDVNSGKQTRKSGNSTVQPKARPQSLQPNIMNSIAAQNLEIAEYKRRIASLEEQLNQMKSTICYELQEREKDKDTLLMNLNLAHNERERFEEDNINLRNLLDGMRAGGPTQPDSYYAERLDNLNQKTMSWVASAFKSRQTGIELSEMDEKFVIQILERYLQGRSVLSMMKRSRISVRTLSQSPRRRIALVRQLIWLQLSETIFYPFCFGLSGDMSPLMSSTLQSISVNGIVLFI